MTRRPRPSTFRAASGRTLVELMVVVALGTGIVLGVGSLFLAMDSTGRKSESGASLQDTGNTALLLIGAAVRQAGYSEIVGTSSTRQQALIVDGDAVAGCGSGLQFNNPGTRDYSCVAKTGRSDSVMVAYQADNVVAPSQAGVALDCLGQTPPLEPVSPDFAALAPGGQVRVVRNVYFAENGNLWCLGNGNAAAQALASGVEEFVVYYGFDAARYNAPATANAERPSAGLMLGYSELQGLPPVVGQSPWDFVVSVYICIRLVGETGTATSGASYRRCAQTAGGVMAPRTDDTSTDGRERRIFEQTFALRSLAAPTVTVSP